MGTTGDYDGVKVHLIDTVEGLRSIETVWKDLWERCDWADLFTRFEWVLNWWTHFGHGTGPAALVVHNGDQLTGIPGRGARLHVLVVSTRRGVIAIAPLVLVRAWWRHWPVRILAMPVNSHSPRSGWLCASDVDTAAAAIAGHLYFSRTHDLIVLDGVARDSGFIDRLRATAALRRSQGQDVVAWSHSYLGLAGNWGEYLGGKTGNFRRSLRRSEQALLHLGEIRATCYGGREAATVGMGLFFEVDGESWKANLGESVARQAKLGDFYRDLARAVGGHGGCEVWVLSVDDEPAAAFLCFVEKDVVYIYKASYKRKFASPHCSPGFVLMARVVEVAFQRRRRGIDFLGRVPFLERWASEDRPFDQLFTYGHHLYPRLIRRIGDGKARESLAKTSLRRHLTRLWSVTTGQRGRSAGV